MRLSNKIVGLDLAAFSEKPEKRCFKTLWTSCLKRVTHLICGSGLSCPAWSHRLISSSIHGRRKEAGRGLTPGFWNSTFLC